MSNANMTKRTMAFAVMAAILVAGLVLSSALGRSGTAYATDKAKTKIANQVVKVEIKKGAANLKDKAFAPNPVKIKAGDTVTWMNADTAAHTVTSGKGLKDKNSGKLFDSKVIAPGKEFSFKFDKKGTYFYYCTLHPQMVGKVIVQ